MCLGNLDDISSQKTHGRFGFFGFDLVWLLVFCSTAIPFTANSSGSAGSSSNDETTVEFPTGD